MWKTKFFTFILLIDLCVTLKWGFRLFRVRARCSYEKRLNGEQRQLIEHAMD